MRRHAEWSTLVDERIMEFLRDQGSRQPKQIADGLADAGMEYNQKYVGRRCRKLASEGLLRNLGNGIYTLAENGEQYLDGELDATTL